MPATDEFVARTATELLVRFRGQPIRITRYTNHGNVIPDGGWMVLWARGSMNPWYLSRNGEWRYKSGDTWPSAKDAITFLETRAIDAPWRPTARDAIAFIEGLPMEEE